MNKNPLSRTWAASLALAMILGAAQGALCEEGTGRQATQSPWSFHSELDLFLGLKAGAEYSFSDAFALRATAGACLISPLKMSYTIVGISHLMPRGSGLQLDIEYGLIYADFNALEPIIDLDPSISWASAYWMPGASAAIGFRMKGGHQLSLRAGGGFLTGYDKYAWQTPQAFPMVGLQYDYKP